MLRHWLASQEGLLPNLKVESKCDENVLVIFFTKKGIWQQTIPFLFLFLHIGFILQNKKLLMHIVCFNTPMSTNFSKNS
jgi:hypothetical protein